MLATFSVFASVGNGSQPFRRFADILRQALELSGNPPCLFQCGHTEVPPIPNCRIVPFFTREEFSMHLDAASHVFLHGGAGSLFMTLRAGKRPAVMPRRCEYNEIIDNHQLQLVEIFGEQELLFPIEDQADLAAYLQLHRPIPKQRIELTTSALFTNLKQEILQATL